MTQKSNSYSIIVPVFNGEIFLEEITERLINTAKTNGINLKEIIFVDDASKDASWKKIGLLKNVYPDIVKGIKLSRNFGQHNSTCAGINAAAGNWIITMDDDLETNPEDIVLLINNQNAVGSNVVYGKFKRANRNLVKKFFKFIYEISAKIIGGDSKVNGSSFRLIESKLAKKIAAGATNFVFIDEVIFWYTNNISFVHVPHNRSKRDNSHYSIKDLFKLGGDVVMYSSLLPLQTIKIAGFLMSFVMFFIGLYFILKQLFFNVPVQGFTALIVAITFSTGIIIFILGVIGVYLGKLFRNSNNSPVYSIEEEI